MSYLELSTDGCVNHWRLRAYQDTVNLEFGSLAINDEVRVVS